MLLDSKIYIGLELEFEGNDAGKALQDIDAANLQHVWTAKRDHSLRPADRNSEFIFANPLAGNDAVNSINGLGPIVAKKDYRLSWRCGMHVHLDHRDEPVQTATNEILLACFLDRVWYGWDNSGRQESKFCVPISSIWLDMRGSPKKLIRAAEPAPRIQRNRIVLDPADPNRVRLEQVPAPPGWQEEPVINKSKLKGTRREIPNFRAFKYTGVNITRLLDGDIGTVEYRYAAGTKKPERMFEFINMSQACMLVARDFKSTSDLLLSFVRAKNYENWIVDYMPRSLHTSWLSGIENMQGEHSPSLLEREAALMLAKHCGAI